MITNLNKRKLFHIYCGRFFLKKTRVIPEYFINFSYSLSHIYTFIRELVKCTFGLVSRCVLLWIFLWLLLKVSVNSFSLFIVLFCNVNETSLLDKKNPFLHLKLSYKFFEHARGAKFQSYFRMYSFFISDRATNYFLWQWNNKWQNIYIHHKT